MRGTWRASDAAAHDASVAMHDALARPLSTMLADTDAADAADAAAASIALALAAAASASCAAASGLGAA